jgi:malonyl CoA-acyl carrier protein transacylase
MVANVTGDVVTERERVLDLLSQQLKSAVQWTRSMHAFAAVHPAAPYEVGPGAVLAGLMKRIVDNVEVLSLSSVAALP